MNQPGCIMFAGRDRCFHDGFRSYGTLVVWSPSLSVQVIWRNVVAGQQFLSLGRRESLPGPHGRAASGVGFDLFRTVFSRILRFYEGNGKSTSIIKHLSSRLFIVISATLGIVVHDVVISYEESSWPETSQRPGENTSGRLDQARRTRWGRGGSPSSCFRSLE